MADSSTNLLSESSLCFAGTFRWMSPELLDPSRFGSDGRQTRESDCYALGMVIYEVEYLRLHNALVFHSPFPGFNWPPPVLLSARLLTRDRCGGRPQASRKAS